MSQFKKFIITKDKTVGDQLIAYGFKLISQIGDTYIFMNQPIKNFNFDGIDKSKYCFSNILSM